MTVTRATARRLPSRRGERLHLQDGPIDLILLAEGTPDAVAAAYRAATRFFADVLDRLCAELPLLRSPVRLDTTWPNDAIARRMRAAVDPFAAFGFITPMAAVAGAVAEAVLAAMVEAAPLERACVNNGGDIALHLAPRQVFTVGMVSRPELPGPGGPALFASLVVGNTDPVRGIATSGWRGRSFSLGIADAVTVLAGTSATADAAATVIANAVDLSDHPAILRCPARALQQDSDLGDLPVTRNVAQLSAQDRTAALASGLRRANRLVARGDIFAAALHLQGRSVATATASTNTQLVLQMDHADG